jgi:NAD(P)-dependent dehydrogenase (short-subunit alcohol dehydrogenase family)
MNTRKTWFITGASKGLGLALVQELLKEGYNVAATSRSAESLQEAVGAESDRFLALQMDLGNEASVASAIAAATERFGTLNVIVNNAGYGMIGALEELSDAEARANFEVNVFGALNVIRAVLPQLRAQGSGHILNIASIGGFSGAYPGFGIYCATKFAMHGFTDALAQEIRPFGLQATLVMPGYFRTNFLSADSLAVPQHENADYANVRETQRMHTNSINENQPGDPVKAARAMIEVAQMPQAPLHLFLGADAYETAKQKIAAVETDMESVRRLATSTGFESAAVAG